MLAPQAAQGAPEETSVEALPGAGRLRKHSTSGQRADNSELEIKLRQRMIRCEGREAPERGGSEPWRIQVPQQQGSASPPARPKAHGNESGLTPPRHTTGQNTPGPRASQEEAQPAVLSRTCSEACSEFDSVASDGLLDLKAEDQVDAIVDSARTPPSRASEPAEVANDFNSVASDSEFLELEPQGGRGAAKKYATFRLDDPGCDAETEDCDTTATGPAVQPGTARQVRQQRGWDWNPVVSDLSEVNEDFNSAASNSCPSDVEFLELETDRERGCLGCPSFRLDDPLKDVDAEEGDNSASATTCAKSSQDFLGYILNQVPARLASKINHLLQAEENTEQRCAREVAALAASQASATKPAAAPSKAEVGPEGLLSESCQQEVIAAAAKEKEREAENLRLRHGLAALAAAACELTESVKERREEAAEERQALARAEVMHASLLASERSCSETLLRERAREAQLLKQVGEQASELRSTQERTEELTKKQLLVHRACEEIEEEEAKSCEIEERLEAEAVEMRERSSEAFAHLSTDQGREVMLELREEEMRMEEERLRQDAELKALELSGFRLEARLEAQLSEEHKATGDLRLALQKEGHLREEAKCELRKEIHEREFGLEAQNWELDMEISEERTQAASRALEGSEAQLRLLGVELACVEAEQETLSVGINTESQLHQRATAMREDRESNISRLRVSEDMLRAELEAEEAMSRTAREAEVEAALGVKTESMMEAWLEGELASILLSTRTHVKELCRSHERLTDCHRCRSQMVNKVRGLERQLADLETRASLQGDDSTSIRDQGGGSTSSTKQDVRQLQREAQHVLWHATTLLKVVEDEQTNWRHSAHRDRELFSSRKAVLPMLEPEPLMRPDLLLAASRQPGLSLASSSASTPALGLAGAGREASQPLLPENLSDRSIANELTELRARRGAKPAEIALLTTQVWRECLKSTSSSDARVHPLRWGRKVP